MPTATIPRDTGIPTFGAAGQVPYGSFDERQANALRNAGGDANSALYKQWLGTYGASGTNPSGVPYGSLATNVNQFMTNQALQPYLQNLPGYAGAIGQRSQNTASMLAGQLPQDVITQIQQQAAERGVGGGAPNSPNSNAAYLRALGLNSLQMQQEGSQQLSQSIADTPVPELWNPLSLAVPQMQAQQELTTAQNAQQLQQQQAAQRAASAAWNANRNNGTFYDWTGMGQFQRR